MKKQVILSVLLMLCVVSAAISSTLVQENFESYSLNTWPSSWSGDGNADDSANNKIVQDPTNPSNKVLKMYGNVGGCWGALAYYPCAFPNDFWVEARVRNGSEILSGCHPYRAGFGMRHGTYWYGATNPAFDWVQFTNTSLATGWSDVLLPNYQTNQWYNFKIHHERSGDQVTATYWVNGQYVGQRIISVSNYPANLPLNHFEIFAQEGSVYFDDIKVYTEGSNGLIGYWSFDNSADAGHDDSGFGHNGVVNGATSVTGIHGKALKFDGVDDRVDLGNDLSSSSTGTVSFWVKIQAGQPYYALFDCQLVDRSSDDLFRILITGAHKIQVQRYVHPAYKNNAIDSIPALATDSWQYITVTSDGSTWKIYINGSEVGRTVVAGANTGEWWNSLSASPHKWQLGVSIVKVSGDTYGKADIDEVRIYNRALSQAEVQELYSNIDIEVPKGDYKINLPSNGNSTLLLWNSQSKTFESTIASSAYDAKKDAVVIVHGMNNSGREDWICEMAQYISQEDMDNLNVFSWDWEEDADGLGWVDIAPPTENVEPQSKLLANALLNSIVPDIKNAASIRMIGHSLGAALVARTVKILESKGIDVNRVSLLDAPEKWNGFLKGRTVKIEEVVENISARGVLVDNYPTQFGVNYADATNFNLKNAADAAGSKVGWIGDHSFAHYWYNGTIQPNMNQLPSQSGRYQLKLLYDYYDWIENNITFWSGVQDVGYNLVADDFQKETFIPQVYVEQYPIPFVGVYPFIFEELNAIVKGPIYNNPMRYPLDETASWQVDGTAFVENGQMNIYTNSPSYLFNDVNIPENASVLRFDYQFLSATVGDMLYLYADEELLWMMSSSSYDMDNMINTGWMDIAHLAGKTVRLCFALNNITEEQAHAVIDNLEFAEEIGPENAVPVANAGLDITAYADSSGYAEVALDGSASSDSDGDELFYMWVLDETVIANGETPTVSLPVGVHKIQLTVRDLYADSAPDDVNVTVVAPITGKLSIMPVTINRRSNQPHIIAMLDLSESVAKNDIDCNEPLSLYPGDIAASKKWVLPYSYKGRKYVKILAFFDKNALMDAVPQNGQTELDVVGKLKSGQYFYGSDTVRIINIKWKLPW